MINFNVGFIRIGRPDTSREADESVLVGIEYVMDKCRSFSLKVWLSIQFNDVETQKYIWNIGNRGR